MKQTESAVRMLISAYKAVLTNCYIKENLLGRGKRLVKGAALSSFLTAVLAGISSPSFARDLDPINNRNCDGYSVDNPPYEEAVTIDGEDDSAIDITIVNKDIRVSTSGDNSNISLSSDRYGIKLGNDSSDESTDNVNITLDSSADIKINVSADAKESTGDGINLSGKVSNSNITLKAQGGNEIVAAYENGDGVYIGQGSTGNVSLEAVNGDNKITVGNNGINNYGKGIVKVTADNGTNIIKSGVGHEESSFEGDGLRIDKNSVGGKIEFIAQNNIIDAGDAGLNNSSDNENASISVTATSGSNIVHGNQEGVLLNGSGTITVTAKNPNPDISLLVEVGEDDAKGFNNFLTGDIYGVHAGQDSNGTFNAIADNNNYVSGGEYGIWTEASSGQGPTINLDAEQDNIIGFTGTFYDDEENVIEGEIGKTGIMVESGTINLTAGNANIITTTENGIIATGDNEKST